MDQNPSVLGVAQTQNKKTDPAPRNSSSEVPGLFSSPMLQGEPCSSPLMPAVDVRF